MRDLVEAAMAARKKAHAPYSKFYVGAAMRDENGGVHGGCNIENAAYPQGWCAEPSAISALVMSGSSRITEVVVMGNGGIACARHVEDVGKKSGNLPGAMSRFTAVRKMVICFKLSRWMNCCLPASGRRICKIRRFSYLRKTRFLIGPKHELP